MAGDREDELVAPYSRPWRRCMPVCLDPVLYIGLTMVVGWRIDSIGDGYFEYPSVEPGSMAT